MRPLSDPLVTIVYKSLPDLPVRRMDELDGHRSFPTRPKARPELQIKVAIRHGELADILIQA